MANSLHDRGIRGRIERDIETMRTQVRKSSLSPADANEFAEIEARHEELQQRMVNLEAQGKSEHYIATTLAADFNELMQSIGHWIVRQDTKAGRE